MAKKSVTNQFFWQVKLNIFFATLNEGICTELVIQVNYFGPPEACNAQIHLCGTIKPTT
jgi:hypothetical protein